MKTMHQTFYLLFGLSFTINISVQSYQSTRLSHSNERTSIFDTISVDGKSEISITTEPPFVTVRVPLRDGVELEADYFVKTTSESYPVIVEITPYGRILGRPNFRNEAEYWINNGYAFVIADARGTGNSSGEFIFFTQEGKDGYDLIEWIAKQPWCNGRVGMRGASYSGENQWFTAREKPPHLLCITPSATPSQPMTTVPYSNGAFNLQWALNWVGQSLSIEYPPAINPHPDPNTWLNQRPLRQLDQFVIGRNLSLYQTFLDHPTFDKYWQEIFFGPDDFSRIDIPTLAFTGWYDSTLTGSIEHYQSIVKYSPRKNDHFLVIGLYSHTTAPDGGYDYLTDLPVPYVGEIQVPSNALLPGRNMTREFYDWCLKNQSRPDWQQIRTYIPINNTWLTPKTFPPEQTRQRSLFLTSDGHANGINGDGKLQWTLPSVDQVDRYEYNPFNPILSTSESISLEYPVDIKMILNRSDILVYTSDYLNESLIVIGEVTVDILFASTGKDTDVVIQLMDVMPDGRSIKLGAGFCSQLRLRYRDGFESEKLMEPGHNYTISINLNEIGHTFLPGHRIRLAIMSSFFPWLSINPNTGDSISDGVEIPIVVNQSVFHSTKGISRIRMTVMDDHRTNSVVSSYLGNNIILQIIQLIFLLQRCMQNL